jgi:hypothetical protein
MVGIAHTQKHQTILHRSKPPSFNYVTSMLQTFATETDDAPWDKIKQELPL